MKTRIIASILLIFICTSFLAGCDGLDINALLNNNQQSDIIVTYDSDGGSKVDPVTVTKGAKLTEPEEPTKDGFVFVGWYLGEEAWSFDADVVEEHIILKAKWEKAKLCIIRFYDENASTVLHTTQAYIGEKLKMPEAPKKEDYRLTGWYTIDGELWNFEADKVTGSMNLYAKYEKVVTPVGNVRIDYDLGGLDENYYEIAKIGDVVTTSPVDDSAYEGYEFAGWYLDGKPLPEGYTATEDITLVAKWDLTVYTIEYVIKNGTNNIGNPESFTVEDLPLNIKAATHNGDLYFDSWYLDAGLTERITTINECGNYKLYAAWNDNPWETTTLIFSITDNSNFGEMSSTAKRYLAGDITDVTYPDFADDLVKARNAQACEVTNVNILYVLYPDTTQYSMGNNINRIHAEVLNNAANAPDVYCNFVYDMVAASLKGSFANLLSTTMHDDDSSGLDGTEYNFFAFEDDMSAIESGYCPGYMIPYMRDLTLSKYKMYCLASDYIIDIVRSLLVIPVNVEIMNSIPVSFEEGKYNSDRADAATGDPVPDGEYSIEDFYQLIWDMDWTYEAMIDFSGAVYSNEGGYAEGQDIGDRLGFALSGVTISSAADLLYSSSVSVINRQYDPDFGDYRYSYPNVIDIGNGSFIPVGAHGQLNEFCESLYDLFKADGVHGVTMEDQALIGVSGPGSRIKAIRTQFNRDRILFGGIVPLGALEYEEYMEMHGPGKSGYGIAPVPLYQSYDSTGIPYLTQISDLAQVISISVNTDKFSQCTAYLNYQSLNSTEILNEYYNFKLTYSVVGTEVNGNAEMLRYIRNNVRSSFDRVYDGAISFLCGSPNHHYETWHALIMVGTNNDPYVIGEAGMTDAYMQYAGKKATMLYNMEYVIFPELPD